MSNYTEEKISLREFAKKYLNLEDLKTPQEMDISDLDIEILSHDGEKEVFKKMTNFIVKEGVSSHFQLGDLKGTSVHRVKSGSEWIQLKDHTEAKFVDLPIDVVDMTVEDTQCYIANGQINHNTTPGGAAVPFHSSVRIQLIGGKKIMSENDKELPVGINITAKIVKNKIAYPYRRAEFEIHFGKGIVETEQFFDHVREQGEIQGEGKENLVEVFVKGKKYLAGISGTQAWKYLRVYDGETGTELPEVCKNFNKTDFFNVKNDPKYKPFVDAIIEKLIVLRVEPEMTEDFVVQEAEKIEKKVLLD